MEQQERVFKSGNELAALAAKQIEYHVMGYYPITPSTQIAEQLDAWRADGETSIVMIPAEGEHSAAGICYGASVGGGRVINATSANGLLYAIEQLPVQSGTRYPMVMNVACRTVSGPLCIKGDQSDIMYVLNCGWIILFAATPQEVYDFNICAIKIAEKEKLPVIVAFDGFFTSHQKQVAQVFADKKSVSGFIGKKSMERSVLDVKNPVTVGSYLNEPDVMNNRYQMHLAMEQAKTDIPQIFQEYKELSGRKLTLCEDYCCEDADTILLLLGSSYTTAKEAVDELRKNDKKVGAVTLHALRPFPKQELYAKIAHASTLIIGDRQDSYGAQGGNLSMEVKAMLLERGHMPRVIVRVYGLGGKDFYKKDALEFFRLATKTDVKPFDYYGIYPGEEPELTQFFEPVIKEEQGNYISCEYDEEKKCMQVSGVDLNKAAGKHKRLAPGHGACPGCGIPVNINLFLSGIEGNVVLLFQTGCGMVVTTGYPKTAFRVPYVHNLFQNGAATLSGLAAVFYEKQRRGEIPEGEITFIMVSGDGGMDIGMGSALGTALRNSPVILFEYDNGGYMNTGYQLSYSTPKGAKSATSHLGKEQYGKRFFSKDMPGIMASTHMPYVATAAESNPVDFIKKARKAQEYARRFGTAYVKALSACPLNWNDRPDTERQVIQAAVDCCYFPLYEVEQGNTKINYDPEKNGKKIPVLEWFSMMGRTRHLTGEGYKEVMEEIQKETDRRWKNLKLKQNLINEKEKNNGSKF